jgi:hypothetical protein
MMAESVKKQKAELDAFVNETNSSQMPELVKAWNQ